MGRVGGNPLRIFLEMSYPWYCLVNDDELEQGDILEHCPVFAPPPDLTLTALEDGETDFTWEERDIIIMSQSCDLVKGREKVEEVLFCTIWNRSELAELPGGDLSAIAGMEQVRKGRLTGLQMLNKCELPNVERDFRVVDFRRTYTLPLDFCREFSEKSQDRIRLLSPYREHLSQGFARFFMRVGLPTDIPPFRKS